MGVYENFTEYAGLPVAAFYEEGDGRSAAGSVAWAVRTMFDEKPFDDVFASFLDTVDTSQVTALLIGYWGASYDEKCADPVALLAAAADRFPRLRSLFFGDITAEESEISWIEHSDITPLISAFPDLERLEVRGAQGLSFDPFRSTALKVLRFESGGLPSRVVRSVAACDLPNLEQLDLWLGTSEYGGDSTVADLAPILGGERLPALRRLGLENSEIQDDVVAAVAGAPIVARLETLSLAMGVLTDRGAEALLSGQPLTHLTRLDLHHHFLSDTMMERLRAALPGVEVDLDDLQDRDDDWRFTAVAE
ncbi:STM4015 family protein [Spirillospora sp. CA-294931]|uniref:STM4015 family protein n=1 Tax=Spirillospora sp. CA-294931 TaxID=3240042 RepID=UPI003D8C0412